MPKSLDNPPKSATRNAVAPRKSGRNVALRRQCKILFVVLKSDHTSTRYFKKLAPKFIKDSKIIKESVEMINSNGSHSVRIISYETKVAQKEASSKSKSEQNCSKSDELSISSLELASRNMSSANIFSLWSIIITRFFYNRSR